MRISDWSSDVCSSDLPEKMTLRIDMMMAGDPKVSYRAARLGKSLIARPRSKTRSGAGVDLQIEISGAELGTRVFRPMIYGKRVPLPKITARMAREARQGLPDPDGHLPDPVPQQPAPTQAPTPPQCTPCRTA